MFRTNTTITRPGRDRPARANWLKASLLRWGLLIDEMLREIRGVRVRRLDLARETATEAALRRARRGELAIIYILAAFGLLAMSPAVVAAAGAWAVAMLWRRRSRIAQLTVQRSEIGKEINREIRFPARPRQTRRRRRRAIGASRKANRPLPARTAQMRTAASAGSSRARGRDKRQRALAAGRAALRTP